MGLTWADIDLPNRKAYLHQTKNGEPRQVPLTRQAMAVLEALSKDEEKVFPMGMDALRSQFKRLKTYAKDQWNEIEVNPFADLRFHDLRHEALSRLSDAGLNVIELSYISGHKTMAMLKRYTHPSHDAICSKLDCM
jgi:integrase